MSQKIALVTGGSSGIGMETALDLYEKGFTVYAAARRVDRMNHLEVLGIHPIDLDVTDEASMVRCVDEIIQNEGRIDVLVNNAGYGSFGAVEDVPMEEARRQLEVNLFGLARMTQLVLPYMRENQYGKIVNISSMAGKVWTPFGAWYHATKYAVEGFSDCLRMEVEPFGIDVIIIEPGGIKTDWGIIAAEHLEKVSGNGVYGKSAMKTAKAMKKMYQGEKLTRPMVIAQCIGKAINAKRPKTRYLLGANAKKAVFIKLVFGDRIYDQLIKKMM